MNPERPAEEDSTRLESDGQGGGAELSKAIVYPLSDIVVHEKKPEDFAEYDIQSKCVCSSLPGIMLAGTCYPFVFSLILATYYLFTSFDSASEFILDGIYAIGFISLLGGAFGAIISTFTALLSILIVLMVNHSIGNPLDGRSAAISAGSLAGYMPMAWVFVSPDFAENIGAAATLGFLGPVLAMSLGAWGAGWASRNFSGIDAKILSQRPKHRLQIRHMMIGTAWIAVVFSIANFFGGHWFAIVVAAWIVLQALMLYSIRMYRKFRKSPNNVDANKVA